MKICWLKLKGPCRMSLLLDVVKGWHFNFPESKVMFKCLVLTDQQFKSQKIIMKTSKHQMPHFRKCCQQIQFGNLFVTWCVFKYKDSIKNHFAKTNSSVSCKDCLSTVKSNMRQVFCTVSPYYIHHTHHPPVKSLIFQKQITKIFLRSIFT